MGSHPVEVVGRIRDGCAQGALSILPSGCTVRVKADHQHRDFVLDGVSASEDESLPDFYAKYVKSRVEDVRFGGRCTVMMYGPTGSGKSHTMFGSGKEPGVAYMALRQIMNNGQVVSANVLEIYNEEIYDLLASAAASNPLSSPGPRSLKQVAAGRAKLEVRGRKVRNATCISGGDPTKLAQEIAKVEKRRIMKNTCCNDRSSRSHCMVILDIMGVNGRLVLVDMAGSENSEQAGITSDSRIQSGKINQGNSALRRVVECIANGTPYVPYRDSKLTMLLQDSFEDDGSKILMVLCASPDTKDVHKTICTLEYGAKAKTIVRLPSSPPTKEASGCIDPAEAALQARLRFKEECLERMRLDFEQKEKEHEAELERLAKREAELQALRMKVERIEEERAQDSHLVELQTVISKQKEEIELLRLRAEKAESELRKYQGAAREAEGLLTCDAKALSDMSAAASFTSWASTRTSTRTALTAPDDFQFGTCLRDLDPNRLPEDNAAAVAAASTPSPVLLPAPQVCSSKKNSQVCSPRLQQSSSSSPMSDNTPSSSPRLEEAPAKPDTPKSSSPKAESKAEKKVAAGLGILKVGSSTMTDANSEKMNNQPKPPMSPARRARIENIFMLCGDARELAKRVRGNSNASNGDVKPRNNKENLAPVAAC